MNRIVDTKGLSTAQMFAALFNAADEPYGMAAVRFTDAPLVMDEVIAEQLLQEGVVFSRFHSSSAYIDYFGGRCLKTDLSNPDGFDPTLFNENNGGPGTAEAAIEHLRQTGKVLKEPDCDARTWLRKVADKSLVFFDQGDKERAYTNFMVGTAKHSGTARIHNDPQMVTVFMLEGLSGTRHEFEKIMIGFAV